MTKRASLENCWAGRLMIVVIGIALPAAASGQYYHYTASGTISKVQAVDASYVEIVGFDLSKLASAGIVIGAPGSASTWIDSAEPDVPETPVDFADTGQYENANPTFSLGTGANQFVATGFTVDNGVAVYDDRPANAECQGLPLHDIFGFGGAFPGIQTGPSWLSIDPGTGPPTGCDTVTPSQKGVAVILISILTVPGALTSTALPTSLSLSSFNLLKVIALNLLDTDTGQRYLVELTIDTLQVDTDFQPPSVPGLGAGALMLLVGALSVVGILAAVRIRTAAV